jgi:Uma2 family endonuclease
LAKPRVRFTADDIWDAPDDGDRYEVIDGDLYVTPPPDYLHQRGLGNLHITVGFYLRGHDLGYVVAAPIGVKLDAGSGVQPDLVFVSRERAGIITQRGIEGAPDLVVEVLSPSTAANDRGIKMRRYAAAGIPHYWMLNPRARNLEAYRLGPDGYELVGTFGVEAVFRPELFPGLEIAIADLWS